MSYTVEAEIDGSAYSIMHSPLYQAAILDDGAVIADIRLSDYRDKRTPEEARAYAYQLAAAPDLLAACEAWDKGFVDGEEFDPDQFLAWVNRNRALARAAIAKANKAGAETE